MQYAISINRAYHYRVIQYNRPSYQLTLGFTGFGYFREEFEAGDAAFRGCLIILNPGKYSRAYM